MIKGSFRKTSRGWVSQLVVVPYLFWCDPFYHGSFKFWYDPFYHGSFKFKAKLGLGTVLLTSSYHSDSKNGSCNKLFTNWVLVPYQEIQALGFPNSPRKLGLYEKPWACISWYGPCTQLVNSNYWLVLFFNHDARFGLLLLFAAFRCFSCSFWSFMALDVIHLPVVKNWREWMKLGMKSALCCSLLLVLVFGACFHLPFVAFLVLCCSFLFLRSVLSQKPKQANAFGCSFLLLLVRKTKTSNIMQKVQMEARLECA